MASRQSLTRRVKKVAIPKPNKYGAKKIWLDGIRFDSKLEALRYQDLKLRHDVLDLEVHPSWQLTSNGVKVGKYTADFSYYEETMEDQSRCITYRQMVEDCKGMTTEAFRIRKKLMKAQYGIEVRVITSKDIRDYARRSKALVSDAPPEGLVKRLKTSASRTRASSAAVEASERKETDMLRVSDERLREIEERAAKATEGPWVVGLGGDTVTHGGSGIAEYVFDEDADFVAHSRQDIPDLVADLREARLKLEQYKSNELEWRGFDSWHAQLVSGDCLVLDKIEEYFDDYSLLTDECINLLYAIYDYERRVERGEEQS